MNEEPLMSSATLPKPPAARAASDDDAVTAISRKLIIGIFIGYILITVPLSYFRGGAFLTPDRIGIFLLAGALILGQGKSFIRDWAPFLFLLFGYELMRGVADNMTDLGAMTREDHGNIQVDWLIEWDKAIFFGRVPSIWLQDHLYEAGVIHWYDVVAAVVYMLHFVLPLVFGFVVWLRSRAEFQRFTLAMLVMSYGAFVFFLLLPTAPPWLAQEWGYLDNLERPSRQAYKLFLPDNLANFDTFKLWTQASPNPVAALPSLHTAFPWIVFLFAVRFFGKWGWILLPYNMAIWFSVVYLSQHWVVDVFAGLAWAILIFVLVEWGLPRLLKWRRARRPEGASISVQPPNR